MKDEWSLKGKGMRGYPDGKVGTGIYSHEVIETLHKKLIEAMYDVCNKNKVNLWLWEQMKTKINKLFGVKE